MPAYKVGDRRRVSCATLKKLCRSRDSNPDRLTPFDLAGRDRQSRQREAGGQAAGAGQRGPDYERHFAVGNGASDLLVSLCGDQGRHARSAVGMVGLPLRAPVEVEIVVEV